MGRPDYAKELADLLNRAQDDDIDILPGTDESGVTFSVALGGLHGMGTVRWRNGRWTASHDGPWEVTEVQCSRCRAIVRLEAPVPWFGGNLPPVPQHPC